MISGNLEYLMSSLPNLSFQNSEELRSRVFGIFKSYGASSKASNDIISGLDDDAEKFLSLSSYSVFKQINLDTIHSTYFRQSSDKVLSTFSKFTYSLKREVKALRIARKTNENQITSKFRILTILEGNPLEEELQLLRLQWDKLESLAVGHYTDFGALVIYKLKLQVLLRWWTFDANKGFEVFIQTINEDRHGG